MRRPLQGGAVPAQDRIADLPKQLRALAEERLDNPPRLEGAIESLARAGEKLKERRQCEPEDYHWELIGNLVWCITALLDHMEGTVLGFKWMVDPIAELRCRHWPEAGKGESVGKRGPL